MTLVLRDTLTVQCSDGEKKIELYFGDITRCREQVDLLMISAFHGDYTPTPSSVIGALDKNLGLSVGALARDKAEDLRKYFYCWWSHPLPSNVPFRRLLCFESSRSNHSPQQTVSTVFRALVPAASLFDGNGSIISPLLASGDQAHNPMSMLVAMVNGAVHWMQNGLNVSTLKIVVYRQDPKLEETFKTLKTRWTARPAIEVVEKQKEAATPDRPSRSQFDFYLSYSEEDEDAVSKIHDEILNRSDGKARVFSERQELSSGQEFQAEIRTAMVLCRVIVAFLSPSFMENKSCLEQYNLGMCISRSSAKTSTDGKQNVVQFAPFYLTTVPDIPTYMTLIQWVDLRVRDGNSMKKVRNMKLFVETYVTTIKEDGTPAIEPMKEASEAAAETSESSTLSSYKYDIFISYSHKNTKEASLFLKHLQSTLPDVRVFFDREQLTTGVLWQHTLYEAVQSSRIIVAFISPDYIASAMCREEYALAVALYHQKRSHVHVLPMLVEKVEELPSEFKSAGDLEEVGDFQKKVLVACEAVRTFLNGGDNSYSDIFKSWRDRNTYSTDEVLTAYRRRQIKNIMATDLRPAKQSGSNDQNNPDVVLVFALEQKYLADMLSETLKERYSLNVICEAAGSDPRYSLLDSAAMVSFIISHDLGRNQTLMDELHVALKRQRNSKTFTFYPIASEATTFVNPITSPTTSPTKELPPTSSSFPLFLSLLPYEVCLTDPVWGHRLQDRAYYLSVSGKYCADTLYGRESVRDGISHGISFAADRLATLIDCEQEGYPVILENIVRRHNDVLGEGVMMPTDKQDMTELTKKNLLDELKSKMESKLDELEDKAATRPVDHSNENIKSTRPVDHSNENVKSPTCSIL